VLLEGFSRRSVDLVGGAEVLATTEGAHVQVAPRSAAFVVDPPPPNPSPF
jgi:hypothetical protein